MFGNMVIAILAITLTVLVGTITVRRKWKTDRLYLFPLAVLLLFGGCSIVYPNISWLCSPVTPEVKGRVVNDAGCPVRDMYLVIKWIVSYAEFPYHGYSNTSGVIIVKTDKEGEFSAERKLKPMSFALPPLFYREFEGIYVFTVDNRYQCAAEKVGPSGSVQLQMHRITTHDQLLNNYHKYDSDWRNGNSAEANDIMAKYKEEAMKLMLLK